MKEQQSPAVATSQGFTKQAAPSRSASAVLLVIAGNSRCEEDVLSEEKVKYASGSCCSKKPPISDYLANLFSKTFEREPAKIFL